MTDILKMHIITLLQENGLNVTQVSTETDVPISTIRKIEANYLKEKYTETKSKGIKVLKKPTKYAKILAIEELSLNENHEYTTIFIDYEHKEVIYINEDSETAEAFFEFVGEKYLTHVEAIICDINSTFIEVFEKRYPHIKVIYDYYHIEKYFNEKIKKEKLKETCEKNETNQLQETSNSLRTSKSKLLQNHVKTSEESQEIYNKLKDSNRHNLEIKIIKGQLKLAYECTDKLLMTDILTEMIAFCIGSGNKQLITFSNLILNHFDGIIAHADYPECFNTYLEELNNAIKTMIKNECDQKDSKYLFLKIFELSRRIPLLRR